MNTLKVGDIVKCIDSTDSEGILKFNNIYIVENFVGSGCIELLNVTSSWYHDRFKLVNRKESIKPSTEIEWITWFSGDRE